MYPKLQSTISIKFSSGFHEYSAKPSGTHSNAIIKKHPTQYDYTPFFAAEATEIFLRQVVVSISWIVFIHAGFISLTLLAATIMRAKIAFFQKYLIPNSIIAGFLLLPFYNYVFPSFGITSGRLGEFAYHLLSLSFIAMTLKSDAVDKGSATKKENRRNITATAVLILSQFGLQAFVGLILTLIFIHSITPDLFHSFGFLLPLGFAQGAGQAYAIGEGWKVFGIQDAANIGLAFAAIGLLSCFAGGIFLIHHGVKKGWISREFTDSIKKDDVRTGLYGRGKQLPIGSYQTTQTEAIDSMTFNLIIVLLTYFLTYLLLTGIGKLLSPLGNIGRELGTNLWGISFIFASIMALIIKRIFLLTKNDHLLDRKTLNRISGVSVDIMVTSAIAAISLVIVSRYWLPLAITCVFGIALTVLFIPYMGSRMFTDHKFLRSLLVFGVSTGTLSTGLALLRVLDSEFETPVASDYSYASGMTFVLAIPFILSINLPAKAYATGDMRLFILALIVSVGYIVGTFVWYLFLAGKNAFAKAGKVWLED